MFPPVTLPAVEPIATLVLVKATLKEPAPIAKVQEVRSGVGRGAAVVLVPAAHCTR